LHGRYFREGLRIIGVAPLSAGLAEIRAFVKRHGITYATTVDPSASIARLYDVREYPATIVIDGRRRVRFVHRGFRSGDERKLERIVRAAIRKHPRLVTA
jgi:peroxiredoxin